MTRVRFYTAAEDQEKLTAMLSALPEIVLSRDDESFSVAVISARFPDAMAIAQKLAVSAQCEILLLVEPEDIATFRARLPFIPRLASAWTISAQASARELGEVIAKAAMAAARRDATGLVFKRINERLSATHHAAIEAGAQAETQRLEQLALSENYLATLLAHAPDAFIALTDDGTISAWNEAAVRLFGLTSEQALGRNALDSVPENVRHELRRLMAAGREGAASTSPEVAFELRGQVKWLEMSLAPIRLSEGRLVSFSVTVHDVTERHEQDQQLRDSEARLRTLAEALPQLVWTAKADGKCDYLSRQWTDYTGMAEEEQLELDWLDKVIHPDDRERTHEHWFGAVEGRHPYDIEYRIRHRDGLYRWFKTRGTPIRAADGAITHWFGTCTDIQEIVEARQTLSRDAQALEKRVRQEVERRNQAEEALRQAQKMEALGHLTGGVAHDFNNLLQVVSGNLQLLVKDVGGNERAEKRIHSAMAGVGRGSKLASQLLSFSRKQPLEPRVINIGRFIDGMGDMLRRTLGETIQIETIRAGGLWNTHVDPAQIENAILNLALNARDAMEGSGKLTIEVGNAFLDDDYVRRHADLQSGQYVMLAVSDTGAGIPKHIQEQVFEPFFSTKPTGKGTGLGLSMVYGFVKQSGGHIKLYSETGQGTTFKLYFPRVHLTEDTLHEVDAGPVIGGSETILVAEDDEEVRLTVVDTLKELGYRVLTAKDADSAVTIVESGVAIDMVFTDVIMPGTLKSTDLARRTKELLPAAAVLFTSGYTENSIVHDGKLDVGVDLLSKPYTREALARKIRHVFNNAQQRTLALARSVAPVAPPPEKLGLPTLTILVVEDDALIRMTLVDMLEDLGHTVVEAGSGEEAMPHFERSNFDLLVTDLGLPGISGQELAERLRNARPDLPVIAATGMNVAPSLGGTGKTILLTKPYDEGALVSALRDAFGG